MRSLPFIIWIAQIGKFLALRFTPSSNSAIIVLHLLVLMVNVAIIGLIYQH